VPFISHPADVARLIEQAACAAWEQPELFADELHAAFRSLR
jgi:hypothetical protein